MIVKSRGHKGSGSVGKLLGYVLREKAVIKDGKGKPIVITHNVFTKNAVHIERAFRENELSRRYQRKGQNVCYHDILSFSRNDTGRLDPAKLEDMAREYIRLRAEGALAVAAMHDDKLHLHIHVILSGTECASGKTVRISRAEFEKVKESLQEYQKERYPELTSLVNHSKGIVQALGDRERQLKARTGKPSRKEEIKAILQSAYDASFSPEEFYGNIERSGLSMYERSGTRGIDDGRHYRLSTLGYGDKEIKSLEQLGGRLNSLEEVRGEKIRANELEDSIHKPSEKTVQEMKEDEEQEKNL